MLGQNSGFTFLITQNQEMHYRCTRNIHQFHLLPKWRIASSRSILCAMAGRWCCHSQPVVSFWCFSSSQQALRAPDNPLFASGDHELYYPADKWSMGALTKPPTLLHHTAKRWQFLSQHTSPVCFRCSTACAWPSAPISGERRNFHRGVSFSGIWWSFVSGVRSLWRRNLTSYSCFQTNVLAKFVDITCIFFYTPPLTLCVIALHINYQRSKLGYWRKINSMLRHRSS